MASAQRHPTDLSHSTKLPPPSHARKFSRSRSPSRSPVRKAQFAARELDPLLKNLSPDSTIEALQQADAIQGNQAEQNALAQSISDASVSERKLGIRAAVAAKKLKEWTEEVTYWPWPSSQDRAWGAGFVPPTNTRDSTGAPLFFGSLRRDTVRQYEERLDEIWDAIDTLGMDEIKDYVFSSHHPHSKSSMTQSSSSYGRMRDFTALITATVVQALPVLAKLHALLETWSMRLTVLRQIPDLLTTLDQVKLALNAVNEIVQDEQRNRKLNKQELNTGKVMFGNKVSDLGKRVDNLLDTLEGQEDSLPQAWINALEEIENKYAEWVAQAEKVVLRNQMAGHTPEDTIDMPHTSANKSAVPDPVAGSSKRLSTDQAMSSNAANQPRSSQTPNISVIKRKPFLEVNPRDEQSHRRGISEVSVADSTLSRYSLENAEIFDARATPVMPSPKISVIDRQLPEVKPASSWMTSGNDDRGSSTTRPNFLQRASMASMEFVPKEQIKEVVLPRTASHDMLADRKPSTVDNSTLASPQRELEDPMSYAGNPQHMLTPLALSPSPSLRVNPLSLKGRESMEAPVVSSNSQPPLVPRRSSKRLSMAQAERPRVALAQPPFDDIDASPEERAVAPTTPPIDIRREETFDDRLKIILASMPTKIRLTEGSDSGSSDLSSETSSRASSPLRSLKLSPVKDSKSGRNQSTSSGIRVYHLKDARSRDTAPIKLFVRPVGENGERMMVRVGGGWADLAEYLREYSLHHGGRGLAERKLEVARFPNAHGSSSMTGSAGPAMPSNTGPKLREQDFDFGLRPSDQPHSLEEDEPDKTPWRPPPVPLIPRAYPSPPEDFVESPSRSSVRGLPPTTSPRPNSRISVNTTITNPPAATTSPSGNSNYMPLGAAGPLASNRRTGGNNSTRRPANDAWVDGMVNQARAVAGNQPNRNHAPFVTTSTTGNNFTTTTIHGPTIVTTSTVSSVHGRRAPNPAVRKVSSWSTMPGSNTSNNNSFRQSNVITPQASQLSNMTGASYGSSDTYATAQTSGTSRNEADRKNNRMSMGDMGGIRRVFLRKRSSQE